MRPIPSNVTRTGRAEAWRGGGGTTLVELLVVVAIISLLVSILSPSLRRARVLARTAACGSNLRQIGIAMQGYVSQTGWYPVGIDHHSVNAQRVWLWPPQLRVYTGGDTQVMRCPEAPASTIWRAAYGSGLPAYYGYDADEVRIRGYSHIFSYGYNVWGANIGVVPNPGLGVYRGHQYYGETPAWRVRIPSDMIAFTDSNMSDYWSGYIGIYRPGQYPSDIHSGAANVLFCDGRAVPIPQCELLDIDDPDVNRRWNTDHRPH